MKAHIAMLSQQFGFSEKEIKYFLEFQKLMSTYVGTTEFTIHDPSEKILEMIKEIWNNRKAFGVDKKI